MAREPYIFLDDQIGAHSRLYRAPLSIIRAQTPSEVPAALKAIEAALSSGHYLAGYAAYELGYALISKLEARMPDLNGSPLLEFGVFSGFSTEQRPERQSTPYTLPKLTPDWNEAQYLSRFERLVAYIKAGDIYQANLTFAYRGQSAQSPDLPALYGQLRGRQPVRYGAIVELGERSILSLSPEKFFGLKDDTLTARPMKGTAPRGATPEEDAKLAAQMRADEKSQAENLMIVDLLRNDLSRISQSGSVEVTDLFTLETFPTLHQLTSGISSTLLDGVGPSDILHALFPCGSITGAPKIRAMEVIDELETDPRGPYCGAIGYFDPDGSASFNVAIRTLISQPNISGGYDLDYRVGSGVVYDSVGKDEYAECKLKARIVTEVKSDEFSLVETLAFDPKRGFAYLESHMTRLMRSAGSLGYRLDIQAVMAALDQSVEGVTTVLRVRCVSSPNGSISVTTSRLNAMRSPLRMRISKNPPSVKDGYKFSIKSTPMPFYDAERARLPSLDACEELIFVNSDGFITEGSFTNIFAKIDGQLYTPPLSADILPGVLRADLVAKGEVKIRNLKISDLNRAQALYLGNSVRGLCPSIFESLTPL